MTDPENLLSGGLPVEAVADEVIAQCGGDERLAVIELVWIVRHLAQEIRELSTAASPGFARRGAGKHREKK